jgi:type IV pilus assembly protein PilO
MATNAPGALSKVSMPARIALGAVLVLLIGVLYFVVFYMDISSKIESAQKQKKNLEAELTTQKQVQASYFADKDDLTLRQQRMPELNRALPPEAEAAGFLSSIQQVSNISGIDLKGWQPLDEKEEAYYARVPMKLELGGRFQQMTKFVYEVGKLDRIINVENIELSEPKVEGEEVRLKARCLVTSFRAPKPKAPPKPAGSP